MVLITSFISYRTQKLFNYFFQKLGEAIYKRPWLFILTGFLITILCGAGLLTMEAESSLVNLWVPDTSEIYNQFFTQQDHFGTYSDWFILYLEGRNNQNLMKPEALIEGYDVFQKTNNISYTSDDDIVYKYDDVCQYFDIISKTCAANTLNLWYLYFEGNEEYYTDQDYINTQLSTSKDTITSYIGALQYDNDQTLIGANYIRLVFLLAPTSNASFQTIEEGWQRAAVTYWQEHYDDYEHFTIRYMSKISMEDELGRTMVEDAPMFVIAFVVMLIYLQLTLGGMSCVRSRVLLATTSIFILIMALIIGFGLAAFCGNKFSTLVFVVPFLLLGVGVDDMIIIVDTLSHTKLPGNNENFRGKQLGLALQHSGIAITLTSVCSIAAFLAGSISPLPGITYFCFYAAFSFFGNYLLQFLLFIPLLVYDEKRIRSKRNFCCVCYKHTNNNDDNDNNNNNDSKCSLNYILDNSLSAMLSSKICRIIIIILFCIAIGLSGYAATLVESVSDTELLLPSDSYVLDFQNAQQAGWGDYTPREIQIIFVDIDMSDINVRNTIYSLIDALDNSDNIIGTVDSWLDEFSDYLTTTKNVNMDDITSTQFYEYLQDFEYDTNYVHWADELIFNDDDNPTKIKATKFYFMGFESIFDNMIIWDSRTYYDDIWNENMGDYRNNGFILEANWAYSYLSTVLEYYTLQNLIVSTSAVFVILFLLLDIRLAIFIIIILICIDICLFGWMYIMGIDLQLVSFAQLCMAVGLTVDYVIHISHAISEANIDNDDYSSRVKHAFRETGLSVIKGALTTFIGASVLAFSNSSGFKQFFYLLAGIIIIAVLFGITCVPAVLGEFQFIYKGIDKLHQQIAEQTENSIAYSGVITNDDQTDAQSDAQPNAQSADDS